MGNDLKLPKQASEPQNAAKSETRTQLCENIQEISSQIDRISQEIERVELYLSEIKRNIRFYKTLITDMSGRLRQVKRGQAEEVLADETFVMNAEQYLTSLEEFDRSNDISDFEDYCEELKRQILANEDSIKTRIANLA